MNPSSLSNQFINQIFTDNPNANQGQQKKKKKNKNRKNRGQKSSKSQLQVQNQPQQLFHVQNQELSQNISEDQHLNQTINNPKENSQHGSEGDNNQHKSLISHGTNYSTQKSNSDQINGSFSENEESDDPPQTIAKRKERKTLFERSNINESQQNGFYEEKEWRESTQGQETLKSQLVVANQCNEMERECGKTYPVGESDAIQEGLIGLQETENNLELARPFTPGGHNSGPSQESRQDGEMVENHRISHENQTVQNDRQIVPRNNGNIRLIQSRSLAAIHILAAVAEHRRLYFGGAKSLNSLPYVKKNAWNRGKKYQKQLRIISFNVDTYLEAQDNKHEMKYMGIEQEQRIRQIIIALEMLMREGVDLILLQEVNSKTFRMLLHNLLMKFNSENAQKYRYPETLETEKQEVTTMILSKHDVRLGSFEFDIKDPRNENLKKKCSKQSFCQIDMEINGKKETVCIFNCHLISNGNRQDPKVITYIRLQQIEAITRFLARYKRKFLIGDTNIGERKIFDEENKYLGERYYDAVNYGHSEVRGTYLFELRNEERVIEERLDRVMGDKEHASTTSITITYRDFLLQAAKGKGLNREEMLIEYLNFYQFITLSDHTMLDATVTFYS